MRFYNNKTYGYGNWEFHKNDFKITKREIIVSISIIAILLMIGLVISNKIVEYQTDKDGAQYASLHAEYWVRENNTTTTKSYEKYMLRKDENGNWKILYWQLSEATDITDE